MPRGIYLTFFDLVFFFSVLERNIFVTVSTIFILFFLFFVPWSTCLDSLSLLLLRLLMFFLGINEGGGISVSSVTRVVSFSFRNLHDCLLVEPEVVGVEHYKRLN